MSRFPEITPNDYTDEQSELAQKVASSRGAMRGPFVPALHSPGILRAIEATGAYVRFENSLPEDLKELATIIVGALLGCAIRVVCACQSRAAKPASIRRSSKRSARARRPRI